MSRYYGWEAIRGVYVPPFRGLILSLNALEKVDVVTVKIQIDCVYPSIPKSRTAFAVVTRSISSIDSPFTSASFSAT